VATQFLELGQATPSSTTAASIYTPVNPQITSLVRTIVICNTTNKSAKYSVFFDKNGTIYNESTALFFEQAISAKKNYSY